MTDAARSGASLPTRDGYDRWAAVYDHDANPLQALEGPLNAKVCLLGVTDDADGVEPLRAKLTEEAVAGGVPDAVNERLRSEQALLKFGGGGVFAFARIRVTERIADLFGSELEQHALVLVELAWLPVKELDRSDGAQITASGQHCKRACAVHVED